MSSLTEENQKSRRKATSLAVEIRADTTKLEEATRKLARAFAASGVTVGEFSRAMQRMSRAMGSFQEGGMVRRMSFYNLPEDAPEEEDFEAIAEEVRRRLFSEVASVTTTTVDLGMVDGSSVVDEMISEYKLVAKHLRADFREIDKLVSLMSKEFKIGRVALSRSLAMATLEADADDLFKEALPAVPGFCFLNNRFWKSIFFSGKHEVDEIKIKASRYRKKKVRQIRIPGSSDEVDVRFQCEGFSRPELSRTYLILRGEGDNLFIKNNNLYQGE